MTSGDTRAALPPQAVLYQLAAGHYFSRALHLATKLGIADLLQDGPRTVEDLAAATATDEHALRRVLRLLVSAGVFEEGADGRLGLTPLGDLLRTDVEGSLRPSILLLAGPRHHENWKELEHCVRTGEPAFRTRGFSGPFEELAQLPEEAAIFDAAMAGFTKVVAAVVAGTYDFAPFRLIVDVGGGNGALLAGILRAHPQVKGVVFDQPETAARATAAIAAAGLADRCRAVGGDFFKEVPRGADAYLLKHIIHDWDDERAAAILASCRRAMGRAGKLLVIEGVYPERVDQSLPSRSATMNDVNMLVATGGRQRTAAEFRALYAAAGFELTRIIPTLAPVSLIEGMPR